MGYGERWGREGACCVSSAYFFADGFCEALLMKFGRFVVFRGNVFEGTFESNVKT